MSSANKRKQRSLEDAFKHRMQDAEATPASDLWARIDHDLTVQDNVKYKKRAVFYRQLAAACFVLLVMAGSVLIYQYHTTQPTVNLALQQQVESGKTTIAENASSEAGEQLKPDGVTMGSDSQSKESAIAGTAEILKDALHKPVVQQQSESEKTKRTTAPTITVAKASSSELIAVNSQQKRSEINPARETVTAADTPGNDPAKISSPLSPSILVQTTSVLSLMAKDQEKRNAFSTQADDAEKLKVLALDLNGEEKPDKKSDKGASDSRWSMSMAYMPTYFAQNIGLPEHMVGSINRVSFAKAGPSISAEASANMEKARDEYENNTAPAFSYGVDVKAGFKLGEKLKLLAGFGYSQNTTRTNTSYVVEQFWTNPKTNEKVELTPSTIFLPSLNNSFTTDSISVTATAPFDVDYRYRMVSLPIGLQFEQEIKNGWNVYMQGGVAANIMVQSSVSSSRNDIVSVSYDRDDESPFRSTHLSGNVGLGISKQVSNTISVAVGPEFKGFFNTMLAEPEKAVATQGKPYAIGLNMSLNYQLGSAKK